MLEQAGIAFTVHRYNYYLAASRIGLQAAEAFKSLSEIILFCGKAFLALAGLKPSAGTRGLSGSGIPNPWPACGSG